MTRGNPGSLQASTIDRQFGHPSGVLGSLVGQVMAFEHRKLHRTVVEKLALTSQDKALEIGFGAGAAIKIAARQAAFVAGIDPSAEMLRLARSRNRAELLSGRVQLLRASASVLPFPDRYVSVVFEVHSYNHWEGKEIGLNEVFRVLKPGGRLLMVLRKTPSSPLEAGVAELYEQLETAGFSGIAAEYHQFGHGGAFVTARRT